MAQFCLGLFDHPGDCLVWIGGRSPRRLVRSRRQRRHSLARIGSMTVGGSSGGEASGTDLAAVQRPAIRRIRRRRSRCPNHSGRSERNDLVQRDHGGTRLHERGRKAGHGAHRDAVATTRAARIRRRSGFTTVRSRSSFRKDVKASSTSGRSYSSTSTGTAPARLGSIACTPTPGSWRRTSPSGCPIACPHPQPIDRCCARRPMLSAARNAKL